MANTADTSRCHPHPENEENVITCRGRVSFIAVDKPFKSKKSKGDGPGSYTVALAFPPESNIDLLKKRAGEVAKAKWPGCDLFSTKKALNKGKRNPLLSADEAMQTPFTDKDGDEIDMTGWHVIRCNSKRKPVVRLPNGEVCDADELANEAYSGRWARIEVSCFAYENEADGVTFGLESVQLLKHDTRYGSFSQSDGSGFGAVEDEDEDDPLG